jgi:putative ATPase
MNLFADDETTPSKPEKPLDLSAPLAARLRPRHFDEFAGQKHLVGPNAPLRRAAEADRVPSSIFYGPAGVGKTTLARLLATLTKAHFEDFSAISGGVADVRRIVKQAKTRQKIPQRTLLFVDEIHRFNRAQQDAFLPNVEDGTLTLLGATTENPLASLNTPLLSRCRLFAFEPLDDDDIIELLKRAFEDERGLKSLELKPEDAALSYLARGAAGDARLALGALEMASDLAQGGVLTLEDAQKALGRRVLGYDKSGDSHYDMISAYIKSLRGGDPDAALYWMARMLDGGEDPMFVARRLAIQASEDVGNADPQALVVAMAALNAVEKIGLPEAAIPLAQATVYVACAPKSNAAYVALHRAQDAVRDDEPARVPQHLRSTALPGSKKRMGAGEGYLYPHDFPAHFVKQDYLPPGWKKAPFYEPTELGHEAKIARRLREWWGETDLEVRADD